MATTDSFPPAPQRRARSPGLSLLWLALAFVAGLGVGVPGGAWWAGGRVPGPVPPALAAPVTPPQPQAVAAPPSPFPPAGATPPVEAAWLERVRKLQAPEQWQAVLAELTARNPDAKIEAEGPAWAPAHHITVVTDGLRDPGPLAGLTLNSRLTLRGGRTGQGQLRDLGFLRGREVFYLDISDNPRLEDLEPLRGQPLTTLLARNTAVHDLTPLRHLRGLEHLDLSATQVTDLAPLRSLRLKRVLLTQLPGIRDFSPLAGMPLEWMQVDGGRINPRAVESLRALRPGKINGMTAEEFWRRHGMPGAGP